MTTRATADPIVQRLSALVQDSPDLRDAARIYEAILPLLRDADLRNGPVPITSEEARRKLETGLPLLAGLDLEFDLAGLREFMLQLIRCVETAGCGAGGNTRAAGAVLLRAAIEEGGLDVSGLLSRVAAGEKDAVRSMAESLGLEPDLAWTLGQNTLKPLLHTWRRQVMPLTEGVPWHRGSCLICGADATLGELRGDTQSKYLRCGQCGADWAFHRLRCAHCGNEDHHTLGFLYMESNRERVRVEVCEECHGYLKVISSFSPTPPEMLAVEDLATLHLDYIAQQRGYTAVIR